MTEKCIHYLLKSKDLECKYCNGTLVSCQRYMTLREYEDYLDQLDNCVETESGNHKPIGRLEDLEDGGGLR